MSDSDFAQRELLAAARRGLSPTSTDSERVFAAVERALLAASSARAQTSDAAPVTRPLVSKLGMGRWLTAVAVVGAGIGGYCAGFRAGSRSSGAEAHHARVAASASVAPVAVAAPAERSASDGERVPPVPAPAPHSAKRDAQRSSLDAPSTEPVAPSLEQEVRTLRRVERALREQNPRLALALLSDLQRDVPQGQLLEERSAAETMARCSLGFGAKLVLSREFSERYAESAYVARVRQVCEGDVDAGMAEPGALEK
jgi:hypothetical protein